MPAIRKAPANSLFPEAAFDGFGPTHLFPPDFAAGTDGIRSSKSAGLREGVRARAPRLPGVYGMLDGSGRLIYVGKAKALRLRLMSYFRTASRDPKAGRIIARSRRIVWETAPNEFAALLRELELIQRHRPRFNVQGQPGSRRYVYLCVGRPPAATIFATARPTGKEEACYGPFTGSKRAGAAARLLNDQHRLRDCSQRVKMHFADRPDLFDVGRAPGCLRYEIATCSGPCVGGCTQARYNRQLKDAKRFLAGEDVGPVLALEAQMRQHAQTQQYERAAAVKEKWEILVRLRERLGFLKQAREQHSFVYAAEGHDGRSVWFVIHRGIVQRALFEPRTKLRRAKALAEVKALFANPLHQRQSTLRCFDSVLLVTAWFRKFPQEREKLLGGD